MIGLDLARLLQCCDMADWRQIQARIRKAKNSPEAPAKLSELYQRTRDAMVAWELGLVEEKAGRLEEAGKWYTIAAQRFRRADWKKKAEDALTRLGIELPPAAAAEPGTPRNAASSSETVSEDASEDRAEAGEESEEGPDPFNRMPLALGEIPDDDAEADEPAPAAAAANGGAGAPEKKKRRRGRRGGRGRRRKGPGGAPGLPAQAFAETAAPPSERPQAARPAVERRSMDTPAPEYSPQRSQRPAPVELPPPQLPSERAAHGRGDPALASRMAHLESLLRRLVASPLHKLDEADEAPAGPGVFLLSDSDQVTSYYVEACQTLRIGLGNLARGGSRGGRQQRGRGDSEGLKSKLADHLGINESKVSQYMKDHCIVRWIQLDDEAAHLAHFAIGVLRTPLNID